MGDTLFFIVTDIHKKGVADQPNMAAQVDALGLRGGLSSFAQLSDYCVVPKEYAGPLLLIGARCIIIGMPGLPPAVFERRDGTKMPGMMALAKNFSAAVAMSLGKAIRGEQVKVPPEVQQARLAICEVCPHKQGNKCVNIVLTNGEVEAGCGCNLTSKTGYAGHKCPQNKWPIEE
jgi:hypothetical protein